MRISLREHGPQSVGAMQSQQESPLLLILAAVACAAVTVTVADAGGATGLLDVDLFTAGMDGYACFRLPNLVEVPGVARGLLAIAQGHRYDCADTGRMDILARRSLDNGQTWTSVELVISESTPTENVTMGTPTLVVSNTSGTIFLFVCRNFARVLALTSVDGGVSWSTPRDLTRDLVEPAWTGIFTGLPQGLQLSSGRLVLCANHLDSDGGHSHVIFSDDDGTSWHNGESVNPTHTGECSLAQTSAGLFLYARVWWDDSSHRGTRALAFSSTQGTTFGAANTSAFPGNPGADCQGAMISASDDSGNTKLLVGSPWGVDHFPRQNYSVLSTVLADGLPSTWSPLVGADPLWAGPAGYSALLASTYNPGTVFVFYERGQNDSNEGLRLTQLRL